MQTYSTSLSVYTQLGRVIDSLVAFAYPNTRDCICTFYGFAVVPWDARLVEQVLGKQQRAINNASWILFQYLISGTTPRSCCFQVPFLCLKFALIRWSSIRWAWKWNWLPPIHLGILAEVTFLNVLLRKGNRFSDHVSDEGWLLSRNFDELK